MPRTIVYQRRPAPVPAPAPAPPPAVAADANGGAPAGPRSATTDPYSEKLVKYIPAEVIAVVIPLAALAGDRDTLLIAALIVGFLATPFYLWQKATGLTQDKKPKFYFYILSMIAFCVWGLTTTRLGGKVGLDKTSATFILAVTVFAIPALDTVFGAIGTGWMKKLAHWRHRDG